MFFGGFMDGKPGLYLTEPSGACTQWKGNAIGRNATQLREYMEKNYTEDKDKEATIRLAVETLLEVVEGSEHLDVCVMSENGRIDMVEEEKLKAIYDELKEKKDAAEAAKKKKAD